MGSDGRASDPPVHTWEGTVTTHRDKGLLWSSSVPTGTTPGPQIRPQPVPFASFRIRYELIMPLHAIQAGLLTPQLNKLLVYMRSFITYTLPQV
jgi:hypothetical protein